MEEMTNLKTLSSFLEASSQTKSIGKLSASMRFSAVSFQAVLFDIQKGAIPMDAPPAPPVQEYDISRTGDRSSTVAIQPAPAETTPLPKDYATPFDSGQTRSSNDPSKDGAALPLDGQNASSAMANKNESAPVSDAETQTTEASKNSEPAAPEARTEDGNKTAKEGQDAHKSQNAKETENSGETTKKSDEAEEIAHLKVLKVSAQMVTNDAAALEMMAKIGKQMISILKDESLSLEEKAEKLFALLSELGTGQQEVLQTLNLSSTEELAQQEDLLGRLMARLGLELQKAGSDDAERFLVAEQSRKSIEIEIQVDQAANSGAAQTDDLSLEAAQPQWLTDLLNADPDRKSVVDQLVDAVISHVNRRLTGEEGDQKTQSSSDAVANNEAQADWMTRVRTQIQYAEQSTRVEVKTDDAEKALSSLLQKEAGLNALTQLGLTEDTGRAASRIKILDASVSRYQMQTTAQDQTQSIKAPESANQQSFAFNSYEQHNSAKQMANQLQAQTRSNATQEFLRQQEVFNQIVRQARIVADEGKSEATIQLKPEHLGRVQLKVTVENGSVTARFNVDNPAVLHAMNQNIDSLKRSLNEIGLTVSQMDVQLAGSEAQLGNGENNGNGASGGNYSGLGPAEEEDLSFVEEIFGAAEVEAWRTGSTVAYVA